jgi:preprotein translocase subunit SecF
MATVNLNLLALQAKRFMEAENMTEAEAIRKALEENNFTEKQITELDLEAAVSAEMNRDTEQEKQQAEDELAQQNNQQPEILKDQTGSENEKTLQEAPPADDSTPDPNAQ